MKGKGNLPFRSVKGLKRAKGTDFVNHLYSKYKEFTVVKREANFTTRHVKGYHLSREGIPLLSENGI